MITATIAIIGAGNMGTSLLGGLIKHGCSPQQLWITDSVPEKLQQLQQQFNIHTTTNNLTAIKTADVVILAVKPPVMSSVASELASSVQQQKPLIISIAAGIRIASLQHYLGNQSAIVRVMPNTPALIGAGASALYANNHVTAEQRILAESILRAMGIIVWLKDEKLMDAVTALSGCGPAYFFLFMEILQQIGEEFGLPKETARLLILQTALGAARMALESNDEPSTLKQRVASPGGATEQALRVLETENIRKILAKALHAAKNRSEELALEQK